MAALNLHYACSAMSSQCCLPTQSLGPHRCETVLFTPFCSRGGRVELRHPYIDYT